jgi:hypothetical protein
MSSTEVLVTTSHYTAICREHTISTNVTILTNTVDDNHYSKLHPPASNAGGVIIALPANANKFTYQN